MMNADNSFPAPLAQECALFDDLEPHYLGALYGVPPFDSMGFYPEHTFPFDSHFPYDFGDHFPVPADFASPGELSSPSLPPSPLSSADELESPTVSPAPKSAKPDLEGFEYNPINRKWVCTKCEGDFVSTHEARRHVKTAAKCTGKKVNCLRCDDNIHASPYSRKRHFSSKKCQKKGRKRGTAYTVHNAFVEL